MRAPLIALALAGAACTPSDPAPQVAEEAAPCLVELRFGSSDERIAFLRRNAEAIVFQATRRRELVSFASRLLRPIAWDA